MFRSLLELVPATSLTPVLEVLLLVPGFPWMPVSSPCMLSLDALGHGTAVSFALVVAPAPTVDTTQADRSLTKLVSPAPLSSLRERVPDVPGF